MIHTEVGLLKPILINAVPEIIEECNASEIFKKNKATLIVNETLRELAVQMAYYTRGRMPVSDVQLYYKAAGLYAIGPDEAKKPVTWTLTSKHITGDACDCVPSLDGKNPWWNAPAEVWNEYGRIVESHGLRWGGHFPNGKTDTPHMEIA